MVPLSLKIEYQSIYFQFQRRDTCNVPAAGLGVLLSGLLARLAAVWITDSVVRVESRAVAALGRREGLTNVPDARRNVYQPIDHTGDLGMRVFGADLHELFAHAAWGLFDLMTDAERIEPRIGRELAVEAIDLEDLMVRWLGELLYAYDTDRFLTANATFHVLEPTRLRATLRGEPFDATRHPIDTEIKAVTYHQIAVGRLDTGWQARVIFDI